MLLNMLRGYRNAIPGEWMECCRDEATYYGLESSWNARFHVLPEPYYFRNPLHNSKILSDSVLGVASDFLTAGEHHIDFSVVQCDRVGVGVISTASGSLEELGPQAQDGTSGAFYWNDGKLSFYVGEPRMLETGFPFPAGALIRVIFDADERITRWIVNGEYCVAMAGILLTYAAHLLRARFLDSVTFRLHSPLSGHKRSGSRSLHTERERESQQSKRR